jgi:hypothetical protein
MHMAKTMADFDFALEDKVKTKFGEEGFIETLAVDSGGHIYHVQTGMKSGRWLRPHEFTVLKKMKKMKKK